MVIGSGQKACHCFDLDAALQQLDIINRNGFIELTKALFFLIRMICFALSGKERHLICAFDMTACLHFMGYDRALMQKAFQMSLYILFTTGTQLFIFVKHGHRSFLIMICLPTGSVCVLEE